MPGFNAGKKGSVTMSMIYHALAAESDRGLTTRQVSDCCDISIYAARNWLMKLKEVNMVDCVSVNGKVVRWFVASEE